MNDTCKDPEAHQETWLRFRWPTGRYDFYCRVCKTEWSNETGEGW